MTLNELIENLRTLQEQGHGELRVFSVHGASGATDELGGAYLETKPDREMGPFDVEGPWIRIYTGN